MESPVPEVEPNDDTTTVNGPFLTDETVTGSISPRDDIDFFEIQVTTASTYRFVTPDDDGGSGCTSGDEDPLLSAPDRNYGRDQAAS